MFADVVMGVPGEKFEHEIEKYKAANGKTLDVEMTAEDWQEIIAIFKTIVDFPEDPFEQLKMAVEAVFLSWHTPRAIIYREMNNISETLGTAVNVQAMVFGNFGDDSGSGVAFTRNPSTGERQFFGEFLFNAAGEDVVAGTRTPLPMEALRERSSPMSTRSCLRPRHCWRSTIAICRTWNSPSRKVKFLHAANPQRQTHRAGRRENRRRHGGRRTDH